MGRGGRLPGLEADSQPEPPPKEASRPRPPGQAAALRLRRQTAWAWRGGARGVKGARRAGGGDAAVAAPGSGVAAGGAGAVDSARPGPGLAVDSSWRPSRGLSTWWCSAPLASPASS